MNPEPLAPGIPPRPFLCSGRGAAVLGDDLNGVRAILMAGVPVVQGAQIAAPPPVEAHASPGEHHRTLRSGHGSHPMERMDESILVDPVLPVVALAWAPWETRHRRLSLAFHVPGGQAVRVRARGRFLRVRAPGAQLAVEVEPTAARARWRVVGRRDDGAAPAVFAISLQVEATDSVSLHFYGGSDPRSTRRAFRRMAPTPLRLRSATAELRSRGLRIGRAPEGWAEGVSWARSHVRFSTPPDPFESLAGGPSGSALWAFAFGATVSGEGALARDALEAAVVVASDLGLPQWTVPGAAPRAAQETLATIGFLLWGLGAYASWTGRVGWLDGQMARLTRFLTWSESIPGFTGTGGLVLGSGLMELARSWEPRAGAAGVSGLRSIAQRLARGPDGASVPGRARLLPMAGGPRGAAPGLAPTWRRFLDPMAGQGPPELPEELRAGAHGVNALDAWASFRLEREAAPQAGFREALTSYAELRGLRPLGPGSPLPPRGMAAADAGAVLAALVDGFLGMRADAAFGRLEIGPRLGGREPELEIAGLPFADGSTDLSWSGGDGRYEFRMAPTGGRIPPIVAFTPRLPLTRTRSVTLNGTSVDPTVEHLQGEVAVKIQFPLDRSHVLVIEGDPDETGVPRSRKGARST